MAEQAPLDMLEIALRTLQKFEQKAAEDKGATEASQMNLLANCLAEVRAEAQAEAELPF